jgi:hypothetical protein
VWLSDTDQSDEDNEIVCHRVGFPYTSSAKRVLELLQGGIP